ncbi:MAG TPA: lipoyl synthase [Verrucomicrobiae bacterium]|jgi:lipoic acid synthetase|nr:lipoyl synthase [Verrucomicrobiae bacterium]
MATQISRTRLPEWLRRPLPARSAEKTHDVLAKNRLNTVCESAVCPNRAECYSNRTATFMILGDVCTRSCGFCAIKTGRGLEVESDEPQRVAEAAREMGLHYIVVTSVARDDLKDEGAGHFRRTIEALKAGIPGCKVEVLTPDFHARVELIQEVLAGGPDVFNHNIETVRRLQGQIRPQARYERSLEVLRLAKSLRPDVMAKSGIMLGLGETRTEVLETAADLKRAGCDILTIGQYLPPSKDHLQLVEYIRPEAFESLAAEIRPYGFREVFAGPYVRSSYHAGETFLKSF